MVERSEPPPHALPRSRIQLPRGPTHTIRTAAACSTFLSNGFLSRRTAHECRSHSTCSARRRPIRFLVRPRESCGPPREEGFSPSSGVEPQSAGTHSRPARIRSRPARLGVPMPFHSTLHCARSCRLLGARVGALSSRCDAAASGAQRVGLLRARRGYLVVWLVSASAARYSGRPPGRRSPPALAPAGPG